MESKELLDILKASTLFGSVSDDVRLSIYERMEQLRLPAGKTLFNEGESGDGLYLIVQGALEILSSGVQLTVRGAGKYVGELALIDDSPRSATVRAHTDTVLLKLCREDFHQILANSPEVASALLRLLVQKIRDDTEQRITILRKQEQLQYDLKRAYEIQTAMLPNGDLMLDWIHLVGRSQPAAVVGGDYYDYFRLPDGCIAVAIGDVAGHGFYSSLLVAIVSSALRFQVEIDPAPVSVLAALNRVVQNYRHTRMLMTFSYFLINPSSCTLTFTTAGHPYPYLYRQNEQKWTVLDRVDAIPLGTNLQLHPVPTEVEWQPGDRLFLYSDGLIEAQDDSGNWYGFDALEHFLSERVGLPPDQMIDVLDEELDNHSNGRPLEDDFTVVIVQFL